MNFFCAYRRKDAQELALPENVHLQKVLAYIIVIDMYYRDANFRIVEQVQDQSFFDLIEPIFAIGDFKNYAVIDTDDAIEKEKERLKKFKYEFFSLNAGTSMYKGSGVSLKKTSGTTQRQGTAYRIYGCGMLGNVNKPQILIPLETLVVLSH